MTATGTVMETETAKSSMVIAMAMAIRKNMVMVIVMIIMVAKKSIGMTSGSHRLGLLLMVKLRAKTWMNGGGC